MRSSGKCVADVVEAVRQLGFHIVGQMPSGRIRLTGPLRTSISTHECEFDIDPEFYELPKVRLIEIPQQFRPVAPHISSEGALCYLAKGSVVLDIFDPVGQTLACLKRAEVVLEKLLKNELVEDLEEEFFAYWDGPLCLVDIQQPAMGRHQTMVVKPSDVGIPVVSDDLKRTTKKLKALGWEPARETVITYRIRTTAKPYPHQGVWPPTTVSEVLAWQSLLDRRCRVKIQQRICEAARTSANGALMLIESPILTYGFAVLFEREKKDHRTSRQPLKTTAIFEMKVVPVSIIRIDDRYMAQRNAPGQATLAGKRIAVIGCGTVGGYLADLLVKAGAGTLGGQLTLVDFDRLMPQNIGRHRLGFPSLFENKAKALAEELRRNAPGADVRGLPVTVQLAELGAIDLLVDATGEESLGHWLSAKHGRASVAMLSVWIEGPGIAIRGLLREGREGACCRCLSNHTRKGQYSAVVGDMPVIFAGQGCEGLYVPFPATVSIQAASLGVEMTLAWANNDFSPALRTKVLDRRYELKTPDCDPDRHIDCPACGI